MAKKKAQDFGEWYSGSEEREKAVNAAASSHTSRDQAQDFGVWYTEGAYTPYNTLRFVANEVAQNNATPKSSRYYLYNENNWNRQTPDGGENYRDRIKNRISDYNSKVEDYNQFLYNDYMKNVVNPELEKQYQNAKDKARKEPLASAFDTALGRITGNSEQQKLPELAKGGFSNFSWNDYFGITKNGRPGEESAAEEDRVQNNTPKNVLAPERETPNVFEQNRENLRQYISYKRNENSVTGSYIMDEMLGLEPKEETKDTGTEHYNRYSGMTAQEIGVEWDRYKERTTPDLLGAQKLLTHLVPGGDSDEIDNARRDLGKKYGIDAFDVSQLQGLVDELKNVPSAAEDYTTAKNLLNYTFPDTEEVDYDSIRERLRGWYGIDPDNPDELRNLVRDLQDGAVYTSDGRTTFKQLYKDAIGRGLNTPSELPMEDQVEIQRLYSLGIDELEQMFEERTNQASRYAEDIPIVEELLYYADNPEFDGVTGEIGDMRDYIKETYGIDPTSGEALNQWLRANDPNTVKNVLYTDSNGKVYTFQDLAYNARNREAFTNLETDSESYELLSEGYQIYENINYLSRTEQTGAPLFYQSEIEEMQGELDEIVSKLESRGYDFYDMAQYLTTEEGKQRYIMQQTAYAEFASEHPVAANALAFIAQPAQALEWMSTAATSGSGDPDDLRNYVPMNYYGMDTTNFVETVNQVTQGKIAQEVAAFTKESGIGWNQDTVNKIADSIYSGKFSSAQSRVLMLGCGALFGPAGEWVALAIMGSAAASSSLKKNIDRGLDNNHAVISALADGVAEVMGEKISLDHFIKVNDGDTTRSFFQKIFGSMVQGLVEGSEEAFTDLLNRFSDALINKDMSEYNTAIRNYRNQQHMSPLEARKQANKDVLSEVLWDAFGGFVGGFGAGNIVSSDVMNSDAFADVRNSMNGSNRYYTDLGNRVQLNQSTPSLFQTAQQSGDEELATLARSVAEREQTAQENGETRKEKKKRLTETGMLAQGIYEKNRAEANPLLSESKAVNDYIKSALSEKKMETSDRNVEIVEKFLVEEGKEPDLTVAEKAIANDIGAEDIAKSLRANYETVMQTAETERTSAQKRLENVKAAVSTLDEKTSDTGRAHNTETNQDIDIAEISSIKSDNHGGYTMTLKTSDGTTVDSNNVVYANTAQAMLYEGAKSAGLNAAVANSVIKGFDGQGTSSAFSYLTGMIEGFEYGKSHQTADMAPKTGFFADLTPAQQQMALNLGETQTQIDADAFKQKMADMKQLVSGGQRQGSVDVSTDMAGLNPTQKTGVETIKYLVDNGVLKNNFHFYQSETKKVNGRNIQVAPADIRAKLKLSENDQAPNGWYEPTTGDIYIDLNAGNTGKGTILFTAGHELTHFIKDWNLDAYNTLAKFLVDQYHGQGTDVEKLIQEQMRKSGYKLNHDQAFDEFVADSMESMFTDTNLAQKLMDLKKTDRTLFEKFKDWFHKLLESIRKAYADLKPDTEEGKLVRQMKDSIEKIADLFAEGITGATENYAAADATNLSNADIKKLTDNGFTVRNGIVVAAELGKYADQVVPPGRLDIYSYRTEPEWEKSVIAQWGDNADTRRYIESIKAFTNAMVSDDAVRRIVPMGSYAYEKYGPLRDNVEYVITFDMDTSCPRTFQFLKYRDAIQAYAKRPLTYNENVNLLELMRAFGQNIPCSYCYVENKRVLLSASYNNFFAFRNNVLNEKDANKAKTLMYGYDQKKGTLAKASQKVFDTWRSDMSYNPTVSEVWEATQKARNTVFNFLDDQLQKGVINTKLSQSKIENLVCDKFGVKGQTARAEISGFVSEWVYDTHAEKEHTYFLENHPDVVDVDVRALALNHEALAYAKSASSAKTVSSYTPYTDQLKNIPQDVKDYVMGMGGIRKHSSNDFRIDYVQDYMMFYADLAAGGWTGHTYTKSTDFVKIFGRTGDRINMSIAMLDGKDGKVKENTLEGMYWKDARELRKAYKDVGVMSMVTSDAQLSYALNSDWIDMIIPFHASSLDKKVWYDLRHWFDYTSKQLERFYNSTEMELALLQKALDDAGVKYSSADMDKQLISEAKKSGSGLKSDVRNSILTKEINRLKSLAAKNGVKFNTKMSTTEIEAAYNSAFGVKTLIGESGKRIKPHFLPGETVVDGVKVPGHNNDVNRYLELCKEYGVHPRFDGVTVQDKNGNDINVINHEGYLKLIKETSRTDSPQEKIKFNLDEYDDFLGMTSMEYAMQQLQDYAKIGGYENLSEDSMGIKKLFIDEYLNKDRPIGWVNDEIQDKIDIVNEYTNKANTGDINDLPGYEGSNEGLKFQARDAYDNVVVDEDVTPETVRNTLEQIQNLPKKHTVFTFPIMKTTPNIYSDLIGLEGTRSLVMSSDKAWNVIRGKHGMGIDGFMRVIDKLDRPGEIIIEGGKNKGHYASIIYGDNGEALAALDFDSERRGGSGTVNGENGYYDALITTYDTLDENTSKYYDTFSQYIEHLEEEAIDVIDTYDWLNEHKKEDSDTTGDSVSRLGGHSESSEKKSTTPETGSQEGNKTSLRDSTGAPLNKVQQEFFKDSKIRDDEGNLLRVYHGTNGQFNTFRQGTAQGWGRGIYFTDNKAAAGEYGKNIIEGYLNIKNPFDARTMSPMDIASDIYKTKAFQKYDMGVYKQGYSDGYDSYKDYVADGNRADIMDMYENDVDAFNTALRELGYDGIIAQDSNDIEGLEIVAFKSEQAKYATNKAPTESTDMRFSLRDPDSTDTRTLLSNALAETAQNDVERKYIEEYQAKIADMNEEQRKLNEVRSEIREMTFGGAPPKVILRSLQEEANKLANRINIYDKQLLRLESMTPLKNVMNREKKNVETKIKNQMAERLTDYREKVSSREYITRIEHEVKGLRDRLLHQKAKTVIPDVFKSPVLNFLKGIDFTTFTKDGQVRPGNANIKRAQLRESLNQLSDAFGEDGNGFLSKYGFDLAPEVQMWIKDTLKDIESITTSDEDVFYVNLMSAEQLKNLDKTVRALRVAVNKAGKAFMNKSTSVEDMADSSIGYMEPMFNRTHFTPAMRVFKPLGWDYAQPVTAFERFGEGGKKIYRGLMNGQKKEAQNVQQILDFVKDAYTREEVNQWRKELVPVETQKGTFEVPVSYIMELYSMMKDDGAKRHILNGGIRFDDLEIGLKGKTYDDVKVTEDEVNAMISKLTDRQKEVASNMQEFMDRVGAEWGNEISAERFGYEAFGDIPNYYPIRTIKEGSEYEARQKRANIYALLNKSFTKERLENAQNTAIVGDMFETFNNHMSEMALYNSWALPVIDTIKWFNYKDPTSDTERSVRRSMQQAYGWKKNDPAGEYVQRLLESINGQRSGGLSQGWAFNALRTVNRVAVAGNIRVAVQQPFSITRAFEMINPKYVRMTSGKVRHADYEEMLQNSSFGRWKDLGYFDVNVTKPLEGEVLKNDSWADRFTEKTMTLAEKGDQFTWATLWHACKLEAQAKGLKGEELINATAEKFDDIITHTQVVDSVLTKSQWMRADDFWHRATSSFMSEPMTSYNTLLRRFDQFQRDAIEHGKSYAIKNNWKGIAKTLTVFTLTQLVNALVTAPIDASRDDDDYKTWYEKFMEKFKRNVKENFTIANLMPYISDIAEYIEYGSEDRPDMAMYTRIIDTAKMLGQVFDPEKYTVKKLHKFFNSALTMISSLTGLPMSNMWRDATTVWNTVFGDILGDKFKLGTDTWKYQTGADSNSIGYEQFLKAVASGNEPRATYIYDQMQSNGIDEKAISTGVKGKIEDKYLEGADYNEVASNIIDMLNYFDWADSGDEASYADMLTEWWDYKEATDSDTRPIGDEDEYEKYYNVMKPADISLEVYETYRIQTKGIEAEDINGDGENDDKTMSAHIMDIIDKLPITDEQKDVIYKSRYPGGNVDNTPWHGSPNWWEYYEQNPEDPMTPDQYKKYVNEVQDTGISADVYQMYMRGTEGMTKKEQKLPVIDKLPITDEQKDALYYLNNWSEKTIGDAPWHQ